MKVRKIAKRFADTQGHPSTKSVVVMRALQKIEITYVNALKKFYFTNTMGV